MGRGTSAERLSGFRAATALALALLAVAPAAAKKDPHELTIERQQELRFGKLSVISSSGEVTVPVSGMASYRGAVRVGGTSAGPAHFVFRGEPNQLVEVILLSPSPGTFGSSGTSKLDSMDVDVEFKRDYEKQLPGIVRMRLDQSGYNSLTIGGRLTLTPNHSSGQTVIPIPFSAAYARNGNGNGPDKEPKK